MEEEDQKIEDLLNLAIDVTQGERKKSEILDEGYNEEEQTWEVIVRYSGTLEGQIPQNQNVVQLSGGYAIVTLPQKDIPALASLPQVEYVEMPKRLYFTLDAGRAASCVSAVQTSQFARSGPLRGRGILVALIDSGVDYFHPDFRNEDGSTRILAMWDQTGILRGPADGSLASGTGAEQIREEENERDRPPAEAGGPGQSAQPRAGRIPKGFSMGVEYTKEEIDAALAAGSRAAGYAIVPERDESGHGTQVLGIAAGNGRASEGRYRGMAPESGLIVVKLGRPGENGFPRTTELMQALEYVMRKAEELGRPVAVNISIGNVYGSHRGTSLLETYINRMADRGRCVIVVGTGNEGNTGGHASGRLTDGRVEEIEFLINDYETTMNIQIWKEYADEFEITLVHPDGRRIGLSESHARLSGERGRPSGDYAEPSGERGESSGGHTGLSGDRAGLSGRGAGTIRYRIGGVDLLIWYGEPGPYQGLQEIYLDFIPVGTYLDSGVWTILLTPVRVVAGDYQMWMVDARARGEGTRFLRPSADATMTIPSTASGVIAAGAYDARSNSYAAFSGRGWPDESFISKPDLAAPGVDITTTAAGGGYVSVTGTSFATPFVTGAAALLMQWGITDGNDPYLYGEKVRAYLRSGARQLPGFARYPNNQIGYGALCVRDSLPE